MPSIRTWFPSVALAIISFAICGPSRAAPCGGDFNAWLAEFKSEAAMQGISQRAIASALDGVVDDPETVRRYAAEMLRSIMALVELVEDLFELTQVDTTSFAEDSRMIPLADAVRRATELCSDAAAAGGVEVRAELADAADAQV